MKIVRMTFTSPNPTSENPFETKPHLLHQDRHYLQGMAGGIRTNALILQNLLRLYWQLGASPGNEYIIYGSGIYGSIRHSTCEKWVRKNTEHADRMERYGSLETRLEGSERLMGQLSHIPLHSRKTNAWASWQGEISPYHKRQRWRRRQLGNFLPMDEESNVGWFPDSQTLPEFCEAFDREYSLQT